PCKSIFEFAKRIGSKDSNKKAYEGLIFGGGFDSFNNIHRAQFFKEDHNKRTFLENLIRYGSSYKDNENSSQVSLFGEESEVAMPEPEIPKCEEWSSWQKLSKEKEVVGIYISGHPLDDYKLELTSFCNGTVEMLNEMEKYQNVDLTIGCVISEAEHRFTMKQEPFGTLTIEDYTHSTKLFLWRENYLKFRHFLVPNMFIAIKGRIEIPPRR